MSKYIMTLDEGTTSARTIIYDKKGNMISVAQKEFTQCPRGTSEGRSDF